MILLPLKFTVPVSGWVKRILGAASSGGPPVGEMGVAQLLKSTQVATTDTILNKFLMLNVEY